MTRLTHDGGTAPTWSGDGLQIFFSAARDGAANLFVKRADGTGAEQRLTRSGRSQVPQSVSPDGLLAFVESDPTGSRDVALLKWDDRSTRAFVATGANETAPAFSPDGRWIAYASDEAGGSEIYVAAVSDPARRVKVSSGSVAEPYM